ncbi:STAS-like domain-containing protein [Chromobacterium vaccinii]|nr:STAS-like domain-containing protein [Chromobacterium vaccinii]
MKMISIAKDFTDTPAGRFGDYSGSKFRDSLLIPALQDNDTVIVDLSDVIGFGSSFLEEAFGGLIRGGFTEDELKKSLKITGGLSVYASRIWQYISDAERRRRE